MNKNNHKVWIDSKTNLMWQLKINKQLYSNKKIFKYVKKLNKKKFAGYDDWQIPTIEELESIIGKKKKQGYFIKKKLVSSMKNCNIYGSFWSSTNTSGDNHLMAINFYNKNTFSSSIDNDKYIRCVRNTDIWMQKLWSWADKYEISHETLPRNREELSSLTEFISVHEQFNVIPKEICNLTKLLNFEVHSNVLRELPKQIDKLTSLAKLEIWSNRLIELPKEVGNLTNLTSIILGCDKISNLSQILNNLSNILNLTNLFLKTSKLPKEIGNLISLNELSIPEAKLTEIPKEIGNLTNLNELFLAKNMLKKLPKEIGNLTNLSELHLWNNQLRDLPKEIINLVNLNELNVDGNSNLILTLEQKEWISTLQKNGCNVDMDDDLLDRV